MEVWMYQYRPFTMGGSVYQPVKCDIPALGPYDIGKGYEGYVIVSPDDRTFVVDAISGGVVGPSLTQVREDVEQGDPDMMAEQVAGATELAAKAVWVDVETFWKCLSGKVASK